ncbi:MAG: pyruvate formate lyase family protein [Bacteroidota bacterium]|nr:pyruvate formate lyase family protein [Bacteroidota bacterium]
MKKVDRRDFLKRSSAVGLGALILGMSKDLVANNRIDNTPLGWNTPMHSMAPKRLSDLTHRLAKTALSGEHGRSMVHADWTFKERDDRSLSNNTRYALAAMSIAQNAPLRIDSGEIIVGSATLLEASMNNVPLAGLPSTSHTTLGYQNVLPIGYIGLRKKIESRLKQEDLDDKGKDLLKSMLILLDAAQVWNNRNIAYLEQKMASASGDEKIFIQNTISTLKQVPENPPSNFREAVQSLWSMYAFQRLMGIYSGIGRIDEMLGAYLKQDLKKGNISLSEAREILAHFWIKGCEWIGNTDSKGSGDAQFYQNIILGGIDANGKEVTNEVTYLVLDIIEELHISDFPTAVRVNRNTPDKLLRRIAEVQRLGGGIVSIYDETGIIESLVKFGYPIEEARSFTNDGCWEVMIPGKTKFWYTPSDSLVLLHSVLGLREPVQTLEYPDFESLYAAYIKKLEENIADVNRGIDNVYQGDDHPLAAMFVEGCIEKGRGFDNKGPKYNVMAIHYGGFSDTANSLLVMKKLIYEQKYLTLSEFTQILKDDWKGNEPLRKLIQNRFEFYGNDNNESDAMLQRVFNDYTEIVSRVKERNGIYRPAGISTFGRELEWLPQRKASPSGNKSDAVLATNFSPSPGTDKKGPTAVLKSYCKMDFTRVPNGAPVELKILPNSVKGDNGIEALMGLTKTFIKLGGFYLNIDVIDSATLIDAQLHPEKYPNLPVRIAGWSARFTTLNKQWQDMIINRTQQIV